MNREKLNVIAVWSNCLGRSQYFVSTSWEGGHIEMHCGPYSTEEQAWQWIDAVAETEII